MGRGGHSGAAWGTPVKDLRREEHMSCWAPTSSATKYQPASIKDSDQHIPRPRYTRGFRSTSESEEEDEIRQAKENDRSAAFSPVRKSVTRSIQEPEIQKPASFYPLNAKNTDYYNIKRNEDEYFSPSKNRTDVYASDKQLIREAL